ncbi:MAG: hypothetical protein MR479_00550, partial [Erysipelotrichaceae bacterium]|nr:hypothetical protein [Erysipelotrichaceae bacterium]
SSCHLILHQPDKKDKLKDMLFILYPDITSKEEMRQAIKGTLDYYINHHPQKRLNGKTCGQVRKESLEQKEFTQYPIIPAARYVRYWNGLLIDEIFKYFPCLLD